MATPPLPAVTIDPDEAVAAEANNGNNRIAMTKVTALSRAIPFIKHSPVIGVTVNLPT